MIKILVEDVILRVQIGKTTGEAIGTNIEIHKVTVWVQSYSYCIKQWPTQTLAKPPVFDSTKIIMIQLRKEAPSILKKKIYKQI